MKNYVMGDIHGSLDSLKKAIDMIDMKNSRLFLIGDYVDRGGQSYEVMRFLMKNYESDYEKCGIHPILGNHDNTLLNNLTALKMLGDNIYMKNIKNMSFMSPLLRAVDDIERSFGVSDKEELLNNAEPMIKFISSLPVIYKVKSGEKEFYLSHASLNAKDTDNAGDADMYVNKKCGDISEYELNNIIWQREEYLFDSEIFKNSKNKYSVVGHTPVLAIYEEEWEKFGYKEIRPCNTNKKYMCYPMYNEEKNCINIDTGGVFGILYPDEYKTFYTLFDMDEFKVYAV